MREINESKSVSETTKNQSIGKLFYWLAAVQIFQIGGGLVLGLFVAPASLFVSRGKTEALGWLAAAVFGFALGALGFILILLSIVSARAFRSEKNWRASCGIFTSILALLAFPGGTILGVVLLRRIFTRDTRK